MAQYNRYVSVPHASYDQFKNATLGNGYNVNNDSWQNQCWDYIALLYYQYGLSLYTGTGGYAKTCWTQKKAQNSQPPFIAVNGITSIKRGDVVVLDAIPGHNAGHIALADENYRGMYINLLGQNQGKGQNYPVYVATNFYIGTRFLGIFRNTEWQNVPPEPPTPSGKNKFDRGFPWPVAWQHWNNFKR